MVLESDMATSMKPFFAGIISVFLFCLTPSILWSKANDSTEFQSAMEQVVTGFTAHDATAFDRIIDADAILDTTFSGLLLSPKWERDIRLGLKKAITTQLGKKIADQMPAGAYAKLLRINIDDDKAKALIRLDFGDNGNGYMELHLIKKANDEVRIIDWYDYAQGQLYTESLRQITASISPTPTVLGKILDKASNRNTNIVLIAELIQMNKNGKHRELVSKFLTLDEPLRRLRFLNIAAIHAANMSGDMDLYKKALFNLDRYFSDDPSMTFLLLDYYFMEEKYEKVLTSIDKLQKIFGVEDAALIALKANALFTQGNYSEAEKLANYAIELEFTYENAHWTLLHSQVSQNKFRDAIITAKVLEDRFGYDFNPEPLAGDKTWSTLIQSSEYKKWRNKQRNMGQLPHSNIE